MRAGWLELILIALAIMWLINAYRKNSILRKVEQEVDRRTKQASHTSKKVVDRDRDVEDVDYEELP